MLKMRKLKSRVVKYLTVCKITQASGRTRIRTSKEKYLKPSKQ